MKNFCKLCLILLVFVTSVHAGDSSLVAQAADNERALRQSRIVPADRYDLARRLWGVTGLPAPPASPPIRRVGEQDIFNVTDYTLQEVIPVRADLRAVGETIYVWVETGMAVSAEAAHEFAAAFDNQVYGPVTRLWNAVPPPGVDGDPRLYALFTARLASDSQAYFASLNTYPARVRPGSSEHEMLVFNLRATTLHINQPDIYAIAAHELQHLLRHQLQSTTPNWLDEGFSMFTENATGFWRNREVMPAFAAQPDTSLTMWREDSDAVPRYGAALLFVSYFQQRYGATGLQALNEHSGAGTVWLDEWLKTQGQPGFDALFADWILANRLLDAPGGYGYNGVWQDADLSPASAARFGLYPVNISRTLGQYAADYAVLENLPDTASLTINLTLPDTTPLLNPGAVADGYFWYALPVDESNPRLTRAFDLTGVAAATLHYRVKYDLETFWDYGYVTLSTDGGNTWRILAPESGTDHNPFLRAYGSGYTGERDWHYESLRLDAYVGQRVRIRFEVVTDDATLEPGVAVDTITIPEIGYAETFEQGPGGWEAEGWGRVSDAVPQRVYVQAIQESNKTYHVTRWLVADSTQWTLPLLPEVGRVTLAISPVAPFTLQPIAYILRVAAS